MILKAGITSIVLLLSTYLVSLMYSDKNDHLLNLPSNKANLVLFTVDTLRADHLSSYGYFRKTSPNLDSIMKDSLIFDNAYTVSTYSAPAHASFLTGVLNLATYSLTIVLPVKVFIALVVSKSAKPIS